MQRAVVGRAFRRLYHSLFPGFAVVVSVLMFGSMVCGCHEDPPPVTANSTDATLFGPKTMRLHPIFTQVKDWTGDNIPDGIEALVELQDQFGDPSKASGHIIIDLYDYKKYDPQRKGLWLAEWQADLSTLAAQRDYWNRTSRTYGFQLAFPQITLDKNYVLTAEFQESNGQRLFDQLVVEAQIKPEKRAAPDFGMPPIPTTLPTTLPSGSSGGPGASPIIEPGLRTPQP
jgi:hypothetical protein